ncbi:MAG: Smr/MutS family protein [Pseudomonadota bacterium]|nr:Smr/MutS family protein [Pseudomonadota bacterium]
MRKLAADEAELWARVAATIRPLSRDLLIKVAAARPPAPPLAAASYPPTAPRGRIPPPRPLIPPPAPRPTLQSATLDGGWDKRLRSGTISPDRTLDLHGLHLDGAWSAIDHALERAIAAGDRVVLLITGHERRGEPPVLRGRIRAAVHDWLASSRHASYIAAVRAAHRRHGGGGSLYIILRRR